MRKGQCFHHPYFGCREFPFNLTMWKGTFPFTINRKEDLGLMLWDIDFAHDTRFSSGLK